MIRADTTAPVANDEEKLARATTQAHKAARDGYRFDVGTFAIWAGCDRATTLVAGAQHVGDSLAELRCGRFRSSAHSAIANSSRVFSGN
jgi:hypothetical protein